MLALNLRSRRRSHGLSQEELAHRAGIDRTYISALERSVYNASIDVVDRLARELGVEAADLLVRPQPSPRRAVPAEEPRGELAKPEGRKIRKAPNRKAGS